METVSKQIVIVRVNHYMVDHSDYLIAHVWHPASNARDLVEYAQQRKSSVTYRLPSWHHKGANVQKWNKLAKSIVFPRLLLYNGATKLY